MNEGMYIKVFRSRLSRLLLFQSTSCVGLEEHDVSINDDVVLALLLVLAPCFDCVFTSKLHKVSVGVDLGTDKATLEVSVDSSCSIGSLVTILPTRV